MFKIIKKFFCKHISQEVCKQINQDIGILTVHDYIFDFYYDNDDLEDFPMYAKIYFCKKCGKILSIDREIVSPYCSDDNWTTLSNDYEVKEFEKLYHHSVRNILLKFNNIKNE